MSLVRYRIHDRIFWFSSIAIAFFLPIFGKIIPTLIGIMILNWLIDGRFIRNISLVFKEKQRGWTLSFASFYLLYVVGLLYTTNFDYGWFDLEVKLSLFIFPLIFATSKWPLFSERQANCILWSFVAGCFTEALILSGHAAVNEYYYGISNSFSYMKLAWYFHTSYLSMYYNFAIIFLGLVLISGKIEKHWRRLAILFLVLLIVHLVFLLASKAGIITLLINIFMLSGYAFFKLKRARLAGIIIAAGMSIFVVEYFITPGSFSRMAKTEQVVVENQTGNRVKAESNADRLAVWSTAGEIIKKNFFFGVGTGDVKDALLEGYRENNVIPALEHKFNAHSQYIQTFVTLGLAGFLLLLATLVFPAIRAIREEQYLYLLFLVIFAFNILFESMLEIQQGVVFYAFLNIVLFTSIKNGDQFPVSPLESK
ncbi:MAG: O-antigen ligase family protein [Bacteroidota bacterium]